MIRKLYFKFPKLVFSYQQIIGNFSCHFYNFAFLLTFRFFSMINLLKIYKNHSQSYRLKKRIHPLEIGIPAFFHTSDRKYKIIIPTFFLDNNFLMNF